MDFGQATARTSTVDGPPEQARATAGGAAGAAAATVAGDAGEVGRVQHEQAAAAAPAARAQQQNHLRNTIQTSRQELVAIKDETGKQLGRCCLGTETGTSDT